jgi:hypothetical protein
MHAEIIRILFFSWYIQSLLFAVCITLYVHMSVKKKAVYFAAFQECRHFVLFIPSTHTEPVRASLKHAACRYRVSNTFCAPCMKTVSINNCLDYAANRVFVNYYLYSTVRKMLPDFLLEPPLNIRSLDDPVNPPTVQEEVPPPKFVIYNLILFNIFHNKKKRYFFCQKWLEQLSPF